MKLPANVKEHLRSHQIWSKWEEIVGPELARVTRPLELRNKQLVVQVAHQAWAQQLHFLKPSLMAKIRATISETPIKELHFRVGSIKFFESPAPRPKERPSGEWTTQSVRLSERQEMTLRAVEDEDLRLSIRRAMEAGQARNEWKSESQLH